MPMTRAEYPDYPFSCATSAVSSLRLESFHLAVGNLRCFDASKNTAEKKPYFNWFDRDNSFIAGVKKAPPYTEVFWIMFFKIASNLGDMCKEICNASTDAEIEALRKKRIKVDVLVDNDIVVEERSLISPELRSMVDNICYMAVYGHNTLFEQRVPLARRIAFRDYALKVATDKEDQFYASWKSYRAANPVDSRAGGGNADDSESEKLLKLLAGDSDEEAAPDGSAAAPAAAAVAVPPAEGSD
jgi:hypothetical protein